MALHFVWTFSEWALIVSFCLMTVLCKLCRSYNFAVAVLIGMRLIRIIFKAKLYTPKPCTNTVDSNTCKNKPNIEYMDMPTANEFKPMTATRRRKENSNAVPVEIPEWILEQDVPDCSQPEENIPPPATENADSDDIPLHNETEMPQNDNNPRSRFEKLYDAAINETNTVGELVDIFETRYSRSEGKLLFSCILKHLYTKYQSFSALPERDLLLIGNLFGGIIGRGLISNNEDMQIELGYLLESLYYNENSKMFCFGIVALYRFQDCLKCIPKFCSRVRRTPYFKHFPIPLLKAISLRKPRRNREY